MASRFNIFKTQLVRESAKVYNADKIMTSPQNAADVAHEVLNLSGQTQEHFVMLALNTKNAVIGVHSIHIGTLNMSVVHPRDVFQRALLNNASSIMVLHNHPSGDPTPSPEDISVTKRLIQCGEILGIDVLDHIIIGEYDPERGVDNNISMREQHYVTF